MKRKRKVYLGIILAVMAVYLLLLTILYVSETGNAHATIRTFGDAFWYSMVTLSTVGYGDSIPVTPVGHAVGIIFLILSAGIMVMLFSAAVSFITSEGLPLLMLSLKKNKNWYYFADCDAESVTLAGNLYKEDSKALIIFGERRADRNEEPDFPCIFLSTSLTRIVARKKNVGSECKVFFMKENDIGMNSRAANVYNLPITVYARTTNGQDELSGNIHFFHSYDCCARQYWRSRPLCRHEKVIVIIGFGNYGQFLLERAILTNILSATQHVAYHIFGDADRFLALHYRLGEIFSMNEESETSDSLIFHKEYWGERPEVLERADRIIICEDTEREGWSIYWNLKNYYRIRGRVDLRSSRNAKGVSYFGTNEEIYTPRQIMRTDLNRAAIAINDLFRQSVSYPTLDWEELDDFHRQSKIAAADHLLMKIRILLEDETICDFSPSLAARAYAKYYETCSSEEMRDNYRRLDHLRWLRFYIFYNWSWGPQRNDELRQHPMLCSYLELTAEQKKERDASWELLGKFAS